MPHHEWPWVTAATPGAVKSWRGIVRIPSVSPDIHSAVDFHNTGDDRWYESIEGNVMSGLRPGRYNLAEMLERDSGCVLFMAGESAVNPEPEMFAHSVAKTVRCFSHAVSRRRQGVQT